MNSSSDAAESIVRMSMQGVEVAAKITGSGAKNIAVLLYTILKDKKQTKGKTTLANMLKTNKELRIFSIKQEDLRKFIEESKRYGVLFSALVDRKNKNLDGMVDVMVKAEDAPKINRIVERFKLATIDTASIKNEISKSKSAKNNDTKISIEDKLVDDVLSKPINKEKNEFSNPLLAKTEKSPLSEPLLKNKNKLEEGTKKEGKPSVREQLNKIKDEQRRPTNLENSNMKINKSKQTKHRQLKSKKDRERK